MFVSELFSDGLIEVHKPVAETEEADFVRRPIACDKGAVVARFSPERGGFFPPVVVLPLIANNDSQGRKGAKDQSKGNPPSVRDQKPRDRENRNSVLECTSNAIQELDGFRARIARDLIQKVIVLRRLVIDHIDVHGLRVDQGLEVVLDELRLGRLNPVGHARQAPLRQHDRRHEGHGGQKNAHVVPGKPVTDRGLRGIEHPLGQVDAGCRKKTLQDQNEHPGRRPLRRGLPHKNQCARKICQHFPELAKALPETSEIRSLLLVRRLVFGNWHLPCRRDHQAGHKNARDWWSGGP